MFLFLSIACTTTNEPKSVITDTSVIDTDDSAITTDSASDTSDTQDTTTVDTADSSTPDCVEYRSDEEDFAPIQVTGHPLPTVATSKVWTIPTSFTSEVAFAGTENNPANHEGIDYIHADTGTSVVPIVAASTGTVVYVRTGCPQSVEFSSNTTLRECGSGWGNHIVIDHGDQIFTRYAHLKPNSIQIEVGDRVNISEHLADMGNSGRSDLRHLHLELGSSSTPFDPCAASQSFERVYDPDGLW